MKDNEKAAYLQYLFEEFWKNLAEEEDRFKKYGLSSTVEVLLTTVIRLEHPTSTEVAEKLDISKSAVSQMVSKLEEDSFLKKYADKSDKRVHRITLGEKGKAYAKDLERYDDYFFRLLSESLNEEELCQTVNSFEKILQAMNVKN